MQPTVRSRPRSRSEASSQDTMESKRPGTVIVSSTCSDMKGGRGAKMGHQLQLDEFTQPREAAGALRPEVQNAEPATATPGEDAISLKDIMAAIQGVRGVLKSEPATATPLEDAISLKDIMAAIQEVRGVLKSIIDLVATEVVLTRVDFQDLGARV
ncbi:hypothetical protein NDU88_001794 [Pleurodeles waltl]|uniref:Uncharacterized protein n=1 Tax=Pleurodeles waltl TaxID=8319 RepID=A0AAV7KQF1_PLEWA|nr:hypothetical protein NDU88_001794 [Pleurodeles waltl]